MDTPQILIICLWVLGFGIEAAKHGERETGTHCVWTQLSAIAIKWGILYLGGFFS